ncbi:MAG: hypothetical protein JO179_12330 [Solirubrobacterales bacterium]|nr:hypothetical protein [Solirubrobacterales bacterium]
MPDGMFSTHDPLADQRETPRLRPRLVAELHHSRRLDGAAVDAEHPSTPELEQRLLIEHLGFEAMLGRERHSNLRDRRTGHVARRRVR